MSRIQPFFAEPCVQSRPAAAATMSASDLFDACAQRLDVPNATWWHVTRESASLLELAGVTQPRVDVHS